MRRKERNRARALGGEVTRVLLHLAAKHRAPLVLENLGSGLATRGGAGTIMSQMQYERILATLEQRFSEVGLYQLPNAPKFRKRDNGFIKLVGPAYTSATCSACGHVHSMDFYDNLVTTLAPTSNGVWQVSLPNGQTRQLPAQHTCWVRGKGDVTVTTIERITQLLRGRPISAICQTDRKTLVSLMRNRWVPYRPQQAQFRCVLCGHTMNADIQGALNIARKHLFLAGRGRKTGEITEAERRELRNDWVAWYRLQLQTVWQGSVNAVRRDRTCSAEDNRNHTEEAINAITT